MIAMPAAAQQYSDSYTFFKALKERDAAKVTTLVSEPGSRAVNLRDSNGDGALHHIVRDRDSEAHTWLSFLIGRGANVNIRNHRGETPLLLAALLGWEEGAKLLLDRGATVDLANSKGETPLILAVQRRDLAMVRLLLGKGADPKRSDSVAGFSALDYAKRDNRATAILKLLEAPRTPAKPAAGPKL